MEYTQVNFLSFRKASVTGDKSGLSRLKRFAKGRSNAGFVPCKHCISPITGRLLNFLSFPSRIKNAGYKLQRESLSSVLLLGVAIMACLAGCGNKYIRVNEAISLEGSVITAKGTASAPGIVNINSWRAACRQRSIFAARVVLFAYLRGLKTDKGFTVAEKMDKEPLFSQSVEKTAMEAEPVDLQFRDRDCSAAVKLDKEEFQQKTGVRLADE